MSDHSPHPAPQAYVAAAPPSGQAHRFLRLLALTAVSLGVVVLAVAAFLLSYPGIHAVALQAGVSASLARVYPVIFDAMVVIACAAVLSLRGAGAASRLYAWLSLLALLAAAAGADTLHSTGTKLPHREAAAAAAIIPWALVLIGFGLLLAMLRHARLHRAAAARDAAAAKLAGRAAAGAGQPGPYRPAGSPFEALPPWTGQQVPPTPYGVGQQGVGPQGAGQGSPVGLGQITAPAHPQAPALPAGQLQAAKPVDPGKQVDADTPVQADQPVQADKPVEPDKPVEADKAVEADKPVQAGQAVESAPSVGRPATAGPPTDTAPDVPDVPDVPDPVPTSTRGRTSTNAAGAAVQPADPEPTDPEPANPEPANPQPADPEPEPANPELADPQASDEHAFVGAPAPRTAPESAAISAAPSHAAAVSGNPGPDPDDTPDDTAERRETPPPAFHRMWSSPTPPGEDYDD
jgi:hypothetical protein